MENKKCEDCISRKAVKDMLIAEWTKYMPMELDINLSFVLDKISALPSVTPSYNSVKTELISSEDCISRTEALKHSHIEYDDDGIGHRVVYVEDIEELPSVTPSYNLIKTELDCISRQAVLEYIEGSGAELGHGSENELVCQDIKNLPSVKPTRPHGEWIYVQYDGNKNIGNWHCSNCRQICIAMHSMDDAFDFCPNCGADMREVQDEDSD